MRDEACETEGTELRMCLGKVLGRVPPANDRAECFARPPRTSLASSLPHVRNTANAGGPQLSPARPVQQPWISPDLSGHRTCELRPCLGTTWELPEHKRIMCALAADARCVCLHLGINFKVAVTSADKWLTLAWFRVRRRRL